MPKKHLPSFLSIKPQATTPTSSRNSTENPTPLSVNERISQLRREQTPRATSERINEVTEVVSHRTVPPHLRRILQMTEVDAPPPKPGSRRRLRPGERPPPGPAAPSSWLSTSRHAPKGIRARFGQHTTLGRFCHLARVHDEEYKRFPRSRSLVHQCLRTFAIHWEELSEYEQHYLPTLPIALKEALLSYLSLYGHAGALDVRSFRILFLNDEVTSGSEEIRFLDMSGLLNTEFTLKDLEKSLQRSGIGGAANGMKDLSLGSSTNKGKKAVEVADSWEDEPDDPSTIPTAINIPFFPNLTRLSLAQPGATASWTDLLAMSVHLNTLTHLSLAYWPRPSTTPNAATTSMVSRHATVNLGGSHIYSDLDDDWHEAANILRRLSLNTYCLKYLDLEGCTWLKALTWENPSPSATTHDMRRSTLRERAEWAVEYRNPGPDWNAAWRQIEHVHLFQGWIPADRKSLQSMPAGVIAVQLMKWLRDDEKRKAAERMGVLEWGRSPAEVAEWVAREKVARGVVGFVQGVRKEGGGKWLGVEYGWGG